MQRVLLALILVAGPACLTTVDQRWCDSQTPCSAGFVCTSTFHCIPSPAGLRDAGVGGGGGTRDAGLGGGSGGGGGMPMGGGGGAPLGGGGGAGGGTPLGGGTGGGGGLPCGVNCNGCCDGIRCVQFDQQSVRQCGPAQSMCQSCGLNEACLSNICTFVPVTTDAGVGGACESNLQCGADGLGQCIPDGSGFPDGYCTRDCTISPCPGNAVCVPVEGEVGEVAQLCLAGCRAPSDCRMGYFCDWQLGIGLCLP